MGGAEGPPRTAAASPRTSTHIRGTCKAKVIAPDGNICSLDKYSNEALAGSLTEARLTGPRRERRYARHLQLKQEAGPPSPAKQPQGSGGKTSRTGQEEEERGREGEGG